MSVSQYVCLSVRLSVHLFVCLYACQSVSQINQAATNWKDENKQKLIVASNCWIVLWNLKNNLVMQNYKKPYLPAG